VYNPFHCFEVKFLTALSNTGIRRYKISTLSNWDMVNGIESLKTAISNSCVIIARQ
jgi:hypothetical protein